MASNHNNSDDEHVSVDERGESSTGSDNGSSSIIPTNTSGDSDNMRSSQHDTELGVASYERSPSESVATTTTAATDIRSDDTSGARRRDRCGDGTSGTKQNENESKDDEAKEELNSGVVDGAVAHPGQGDNLSAEETRYYDLMGGRSNEQQGNTRIANQDETKDDAEAPGDDDHDDESIQLSLDELRTLSRQERHYRILQEALRILRPPES